MHLETEQEQARRHRRIPDELWEQIEPVLLRRRCLAEPVPSDGEGKLPVLRRVAIHDPDRFPAG